MENLFSYGTLQKEEVQIKIFGRVLQGSDDTLRGYKMVTIEIKDTSFLSKGEEKYQQTLIASSENNDTIKGTCLEITTAELLLTDKYEPTNYKRVKVTLQSGKTAWIYIAFDLNNTGSNAKNKI